MIYSAMHMSWLLLYFLGTGHYLSPEGGKNVVGVMKKLEIDRGGITPFLVDQAGGS